MHHSLGGKQRQGPRGADPGHRRLVLGTWNVTPLAGKEAELVRMVDQLDLIVFTSMHSTGCGTKLLERLDPVLFWSCPR